MEQTSTGLVTGTVNATTCCICQHTLTDAVSISVGIGPICRGHANAALAAITPHDNAAALALLGSLTHKGLAGPTLATLAEVHAAVESPATTDFRATVKRVAWMLSYPTTVANRAALVGVVKALGYLGFAALLEGTASTGKAHVEALAGRLHLFAPRCTAGCKALKAQVKGFKFHFEAKAADGTVTKASWSAPAASAASFWTVVRTFWPCAQGDIAALTAQATTQALEAVLAAPAPVVAPEPPAPAPAPPAPLPVAAPAPLVTIAPAANGYLSVKTPYNADFVAALKTLPYKLRYWDPIARVWMVSASCSVSLHSILTEHFDGATF